MKASAWYLAHAAVLAALASTAHADPLLNGQISIVGRSSANESGVTFSGLDFAAERNSSGSFRNTFPSTIPLEIVHLRNFTYADVNGSSAGVELFQIHPLGAGNDLLMKLTHVNEDSCGSDELCVTGSGFLDESGSNETPATFDLKTREGKITTFSAIASTSPTPEPSSLLLLGTGLLGTGATLYRRRRFGNP